VADEALAITADLGDQVGLGRIEANVAMIEASLDPASAEQRLERASEALHRSHNPQEIAYLAQVRGRMASRAGRLLDAQRWFRESQTRFQAIGDRRFELSAQSELAHALRRDGRIDDAEAEYRQSIHGWQRSGNRGAVANQLESFSFLAISRGQSVRAARLFGAAEALREMAGAHMTTLEREEYDAEVLRLRGELDAATFSEAWAEGRGLTSEEAVALALSE
jgi:tetratricopeptide (TPR) repeat protein